MKKVKFTIIRSFFTEQSTISVMYSPSGEFMCFILEDCDRGLDQNFGAPACRAMKIAGSTAIPVGLYEVEKTYSPKFKRELYLLKNVPAFSGIRIHAGNDPADTAGCLLPGTQKSLDKVLNSRDALKLIHGTFDRYYNDGYQIELNIFRDPVDWAYFCIGLTQDF